MVDGQTETQDGVKASLPPSPPTPSLPAEKRCLRQGRKTKLDAILGHTTITWNDCWLQKRQKEEKEIRKLKRLAKFLHCYILTQIWSILWCIIENHLKDSEMKLLVCLKEKKIDNCGFYLTKKKKEHLSLLCSLLRFDMKQSCLSVVCEPESALSL